MGRKGGRGGSMGSQAQVGGSGAARQHAGPDRPGSGLLEVVAETPEGV